MAPDVSITKREFIDLYNELMAKAGDLDLTATAKKFSSLGGEADFLSANLDDLSMRSPGLVEWNMPGDGDNE